jgi:polyferredoxin
MHIDMPSHGLMLHPPFLAPNITLQGIAMEVMVVVQLIQMTIMKGRWCSVMCQWRLCR